MNERSASSTIVWTAQMRAPPPSAEHAGDDNSIGHGSSIGLRFLGGALAAFVGFIALALAIAVKEGLLELDNALVFDR